MNIFNLRKFNLNVSAMAFERLKNRPLKDYIWCNLASGISPEIEEAINQNQTVAAIVGDAKARRARTIGSVMETYGVDKGLAEQLTQVWVGYHPKYGGFWAIIAPYQSSGLWFGKEHIQESAIDRFYLGTKAVAPQTPTTVQSSARRNIRKFNDKFGIEFNLDELELVIVADTKEPDPNRKRGFRKEEVSKLTNLDPASFEFRNYFPELKTDEEGNILPMPETSNVANKYASAGSFMKLNAKGFHKYLTQFANEWYQKAIQQQVDVNNANLRPNMPPVTKEQVQADIIKDDVMMERVYKSTRKLLMDAASGVGVDPEEQRRALQIKAPLSMWHEEAVTDAYGRVSTHSVDTPRYTSSGEIPVYSHPVFKATFGQQAATGISRSINPYTKGLKDEIRLIIEKNINRPEMLTTENVLSTLMQHEGRAKSTSQIDIGLVDKLMDEIENDIISEENAQMTGEKLNDSPLAFPDMQSAVTEAQMKFSQDVVVQDPVSKVMHGQPNPKIVSTFTIPRNFTEQDLKRMRQIKEAKERGEVVDEFPIVEQEPEIREEIGIQEPEVIGPDGKTLKTPKNANPQLGTVPENQLLEQQRELELASSHTRKIIVATLKSLIKIADEMDNEGKDDAAEEIHKVIRKYQERI